MVKPYLFYGLLIPLQFYFIYVCHKFIKLTLVLFRFTILVLIFLFLITQLLRELFLYSAYYSTFYSVLKSKPSSYLYITPFLPTNEDK